jgi:hypothetical protein
MRYAIVDGKRSEAHPNTYGKCEGCGDLLIPRCGKINVWHWAHNSNSDCVDHEPITPWHLSWQDTLPEAQREIVIGTHRADMITNGGNIVEVQHSPISTDDLLERERFYGKKMFWIFDAQEAFCGKGNITFKEDHVPRQILNSAPDPNEDFFSRLTSHRRYLEACARNEWFPTHLINWSYKRKVIWKSNRLVFIDIGHLIYNQIIRLGFPHPTFPGPYSETFHLSSSYLKGDLKIRYLFMFYPKDASGDVNYYGKLVTKDELVRSMNADSSAWIEELARLRANP